MQTKTRTKSDGDKVKTFYVYLSPSEVKEIEENFGGTLTKAIRLLPEYFKSLEQLKQLQK
jgi:hypothetical protein